MGVCQDLARQKLVATLVVAAAVVVVVVVEGAAVKLNPSKIVYFHDI
jgi:hypothetical protein